MSTTISTYLNAVPATAPEYPLAQSILSKITLAASTTNAAHANGAKSELPSLLNQLLQSLIDRRHLTPATILAIAAVAGSNLGDVGITGSVTLGSSSITVTPGAY